MKTRCWLVAAILCTIVPFCGISQCGTIRTITYDTTIISSGNNEDPFEFTFPQFSSSIGTLTNVNISAAVSLHYQYDVENTVNTTNLYRQRLTRYDNIFSSALSQPEQEALGYLRNFPSNPPPNQYYSHSLAPNDGNPGAGSDYAQNSLQLLNNFTVFSVDVNTANFMGAGNVTLDYLSTTERTVLEQNPVNVNNSISEQITVSVTYTYCDNIILNDTERDRLTRPTGILVFYHKLYPNPSSNGNFTVQFHNAVRSDWQIETFNSAGQLISRKKYRNTLRADVTDNQLPKGIYIIKATNLKSLETFSDRLLVK